MLPRIPDYVAYSLNLCITITKLYWFLNIDKYPLFIIETYCSINIQNHSEIFYKCSKLPLHSDGQVVLIYFLDSMCFKLHLNFFSNFFSDHQIYYCSQLILHC